MEPVFFATPADLRAWFEEHHASSDVLLTGYYKKGSGKPSVTYPESVDEALCFGWIDGVRRSIDGERYTVRFTPRRRGSTWSAVNIARMEELIAAKRVMPAGLAAFERRKLVEPAYSYEQREHATLSPDQERSFRANAAAWEYFTTRPPGYQRTALWWVVSAKREETRARRLAALIEDSAAGRAIGLMRERPAGGTTGWRTVPAAEDRRKEQAMAEDREALLQHYRQTRLELLAAIEGLSDAQLSERTLDGWAVKDHLAHIALWDELRAAEVARISGGYATAWPMTGEQDAAFNEMATALRWEWTTEQAKWELTTTRQRLLDAIAVATERGLDGSLYGEAGLVSTHEVQHAGWIRRWRGERGY